MGTVNIGHRDPVIEFKVNYVAKCLEITLNSLLSFQAFLQGSQKMQIDLLQLCWFVYFV